MTPLSPSLLMSPAHHFGTEQAGGGGGWCPSRPLTSWHVARNSSKVTTPSLFLSIFCKGVARGQRGHPWLKSGEVSTGGDSGDCLTWKNSSTCWAGALAPKAGSVQRPIMA